METLKDYLLNAVHYLFPDGSPGGAERQRGQFLTNCQKLGVDKEFPEVLARNPEWCELAKCRQVCFFEDFVKDPLKRGVKPTLRLICTELGNIPVIKLVREKD